MYSYGVPACLPEMLHVYMYNSEGSYVYVPVIRGHYCNNTAKTEVCIPYLGYAPCNSRGMYFIPRSLQGAYPRYGIHTSVFAVKHSSASHFEAFTKHFGYKQTHSSTL